MNDQLMLSLKKLTQLLHQQHKSIATAESCTGGLLAGLLTEFPSSSTWFERGFVTYSNEAKIEMLGVPADLIKQYGAVSIEVAEAMAAGALAHSAAHLAVSITGIAGPDGGSSEKPVGTVCFGYAVKNQAVTSERCLFAKADRQQVRSLSCQQALDGITRLICSV